jgi:N-acetylmuramate 1-kinase
MDPNGKGGSMRVSESRQAAISDFLAREGWGQAELVYLPADASTRRYGRLTRGDQRIILMDAPPVEDQPCPPDADAQTRLGLGWNALSRLAASRVEAFAALSAHLRSQGYAAPEVIALDAFEGLALVDDLGDAVLARQIETGLEEASAYQAATSLLADLHSRPVPVSVTAFDQTWPILALDDIALRANADLFAEWLPRLETGFAKSHHWQAQWEAARQNVISALDPYPRVLTLRDFHAENLIWRPEQTGHSRLGLLDFQDAVAGFAGWDLAMLLQDARRDVSASATEIAWRTYLEASGRADEDLRTEYALIGALNAARILGIFSRLIVRDSKPRYRAFLDREWRHLNSALSHPALAELRAVVSEAVPHRIEARR